MANRVQNNEQLIMALLQSRQPLQLEQIVVMLPELSWNQVFQTVDALSRRGEILLRRRGFEYELVALPAPSTQPSCPALNS